MAHPGPQHPRGRHVRPGSDPSGRCCRTRHPGRHARYWRTEDWIAVVLGFLVITAVLLTFQWKVADLRSVVPTFRWTTNEQIELLTPNWNTALDQIVRDAEAKGQAERRHAQQRA